MIIEKRAYARAGLLGNPSDGYFGKTISIIVRNFGAHISLYESPELKIEAQEQDLNEYRNLFHLVESVSLTGYYGGSRLIKAAIKKFAEYAEKEKIKLASKNFTIRYRSSIPRQVGLAGSSAIVTATMRALMEFYQVEITPEMLANLVLSAESDELGISAGLQDRVIQAFEGCVYMDFDKSHYDQFQQGKYERLAPQNLPNLYIAYKIDLGKVSGTVLNNIRVRYEKGDQEVIDTLNQIASIAVKGKEAIANGNIKQLNELINLNFDLRCKIMDISDSNHELISVARACGVSAKFTGSGGSIIGIYPDDEALTRLVIAMRKLNARVIKPYIL